MVNNLLSVMLNNVMGTGLPLARPKALTNGLSLPLTLPARALEQSMSSNRFLCAATSTERAAS